MSMYLSLTDLGPIGAEPGEFIDFPPTLDELGHHGDLAADDAAEPAVEDDDTRSRPR